MRIPADQLKQRLNSNLAPVYLVSGDEPLQKGEAADSIRTAAKDAGHAVREVFDADGGFDWDLFRQASVSLPLFSGKRILDLRLASDTLTSQPKTFAPARVNASAAARPCPPAVPDINTTLSFKSSMTPPRRSLYS